MANQTDPNTSGATRFERAFNYMDDEIQAHTRSIGDWLQTFVEDAPVYEAPKEHILGRLQDLQGNPDFRFPVFAYHQHGDILPNWDRYNHFRAHIGELVYDPNSPTDDPTLARYTAFPVEIPFEIYMVTNSERHCNIWTHLLTVYFWKRPSLCVVLPHWNMKVWAPFEITGLTFDRRRDDAQSLMILSTCMCRLKTYLRERVEVPKVLKVYTEYKDLTTKESITDQVIDEKGDVGKLDSDSLITGNKV